MKSLRSSLSAGFLVAVFGAILLFLVSKAWDVAGGIGNWIGIKVFDSPFFNTFVYLLVLLLALCIVGTIVKVKLFSMVLDRIPVLSTVMKFIPKGEEIENLTDGGLKEVRVMIAEVLGFKLFFRALVTKKWQEGGKTWVRLYLGSCPVPFTGYLFEMEYDPAVIQETGRGADDYSAMIMSFGIRSSEKEDPKPQP